MKNLFLGPPPGMPRMLRPGGPTSMPRFLPPQLQMPGLPPPPPVPPNLSNLGNLQKTPNVLSAAPQLISAKKDKDSKGATTIEAKPQIRNLAADVTRFLPTSLRVKRSDEKKKPLVPQTIMRLPERMVEPQLPPKPAPQPKTKDDAYLQFMHEMQGLL